MEVDISILQTKSTARKQAGIIRAEAHKKHQAIAKKFLSKFGLKFLTSTTNHQNFKINSIIEDKYSVSGFIPYRSEIDVTGLLSVLANKGHLTCLPIVIGENLPLIFRRWQPGNETEAGAWNIPIPLPSAELTEPDVLLVPLLAFDKKGFRLGYGGGFYDRTIETLRLKKPLITIGVAYSAQEVTTVPKDQHDQQLDWILTEKGVFECG